MKLNRKYRVILVLLCAAASVASAEDLRVEMEAANAAWLRAYDSLSGDAVAAQYTRDAMLLPPGTQPVVGAEAIGHFWADALKGGNLKNHTFEIVSVHREGNYAYQVARWTLDVLNDKGETKKKAGNTVRIFEKQPHGKWLTKIHIFNAY